MLRVDIASIPGDTCYFSCYGTDTEKRTCPEWGPTLAIENYYKAKIEAETN